ncbi:hypothetical protein GCM10011389_34230 [Pontibacillus salipaludis]|uniref:Uncharacterized protein n=1 Tax=Pontibacillus salipaludis TaxID=1697394 RepID=A0ABQ1QEG6_9BACI|nr:hypothetical protein GCM10011389_34230 [Pontibacillus salipaludis]
MKNNPSKHGANESETISKIKDGSYMVGSPKLFSTYEHQIVVFVFLLVHSEKSVLL